MISRSTRFRPSLCRLSSHEVWSSTSASTRWRHALGLKARGRSTSNGSSSGRTSLDDLAAARIDAPDLDVTADD